MGPDLRRWALAYSVMPLATLHAAAADEPADNRVNPSLEVKVDHPIFRLATLRLATPPGKADATFHVLTYLSAPGARLTHT